ncbi:MAG: hypothetical protein UU82_C0019G0004 [Candidatus Nomurabacteria bacterium GW2011_GWC2_41_8]|uniref:DUF2784 domain-containing protein n=2 Tax=Candidatus Nomuraibacteriota TaxID=1752729 RepID=A0A1F6YB15_9BACT|nr:MAG: hypothetical protein UU82_C0019G0004 [Candidatus Nomurabacteria bacterium GW2011_GWC2_41_8]OGI80246.1 MAG: hypothetical protein A3D43_01035 [Candidatus Nomurabacteria bacterium RIFCSPHIGHO2_02_FULL_41_52]OGI85020.1 MAG: hypothetical protein A3F49_00740 [Candidatus Nomurabacteria bacterium RIFCSPHIGHO2_12_FULL_42_19]OGI94302.1 MAG: hypothetical protein A3A07_03090 [Candidatus Nomurabacteria bacterium RIFCSPLOWO2_01_FULL_41_52]OGJ03583.1 MAG: hypothetical protein A3F97_02245 [Candidatus N
MAGKLKINLILFVHTAWIVFIYTTWPFIFYSRSFNKFYLVIMLLTLASSWGLGGCWLSNIENKLRKEHNPASVYEERCIKYYVQKWLYINLPQIIIRSVFGILLLLSLYFFLMK